MAFTVLKEETSVRLDKLLKDKFPQFSRTYFQYLIEEGFVLVGGERRKKRENLHEGDEVEVCFQLTPEITLEAENIPLEILYEDDHFMAINKPAGMVVHPAPGHSSGTFVNALLHHCKTLEKDSLRPGIVHRLDKDTSGVLLAAKTREAHEKLVALFCNRNIVKRYLAICCGNPGTQTIATRIARHPTRRKEMAVTFEGGKEAITRISTLATKDNISLLDVDLLTGRTHQIRVHLKHIGFPILGDAVYGTSMKKYEAKRQMLHAHVLKFTHPFTGMELEITAPLPSDFLSLKNLFGYT